MAVTIITRDKEISVKCNRPLYRIMQDLQLSPQAFLAVRNGELLTADERILEGEVVELIAVVSGG